MPKLDKFVPGDLVFAKVKGYPPWPARIAGLGSKEKYKIFFYGTYETATLKSEDIWLFTPETKAKFGPKYLKKKGYKEGLHQIENLPDIAGYEGGPVFTQEGAQAPVLNELPVVSPSPPASPKKYSPTKSGKRKAADDLEIEQPYKKLLLSPSVKLLKPRRLDDDSKSRGLDETEESETESKKSYDASPKKEDLEEAEGRKLWVKVKDTEDIIEINLDKDRPDTFESEDARIEWEMASARKALKFKKKVENGEFVPPEIKKRLEERASKTPEERERIDKERKLERSREKLRWLKIEQRLVELDIAVKTSLNLKRPSPDRCIQALEELGDLGIAPLMLKKQPDIVSTVKRLRKYVGPHGYRSWIDEEARSKIERSIMTIQGKSEILFSKFKECFSSQDDDDEVFLAKFFEAVELFKSKTKEMDERKVLSMTKDPTKPISRSNPLSDLED